MGRNPSFFRSANTAALPSSLPPVHPAFALSPLVLLVIAAALLLYPSLFLPAAAATGCRPFARRTGDSGGVRLMEVTKVEVVPSFKVAISDSRASRARYTR